MSREYIEFLYPEASFRVLDIREMNGSTGIEMPEDCYGFRFFKISSGLLPDVQESNTTTYYLGKEVMTLEDVEREMPQEKDLIKKMKENKWDKVVKTRCGDFHHFTIDDRLLKEGE